MSMGGIRFSVILRLLNTEIPIYYRTAFISLFKKALEGTYYFDIYYTRKFPKPFTFSVYLPIKTINGDKIVLSSLSTGNEVLIKFFISSVDPKLVLHILDFIQNKKIFSWKNEITLIYKAIDRPLPPPRIENGQLRIKTMSPIHLKTKNGKPLLPPDPQNEDYFRKLEEFNQEFNEIHKRIFKSLGLTYNDVKILPLKWKKKVVKLTFEDIKRNHGIEFVYVTGFDGEFLLQGDEETLRNLYYRGIGLRTAEGFGMVSNC